MKSNPFLWYETRLAFDFSALLPAFGLPVYAVISKLLMGRYDSELPISSLINTLVILLPLVSGFSTAHLMSIEQEANFNELRNTYPKPAWWIPVIRGGLAFVLLLVCAMAGWLAFRLVWGSKDYITALLPALPPAIYLTGLSLLTGRLTRSYWAAAGATMVYWFLELQTRGQVTGVLFLFNPVWPSMDFSMMLNRSLQVGVGISFFIFNIALATYQPRFFTRGVPLGKR
jgi:hypothetical protein